MTDEYPFPDPRLRGIHEHHQRAQWFRSLASKSNEGDDRYRLLIAATYFACGIVELMLDAARAQQLKKFQNKDEQKSRKQYEEQLAPTLRHYHLIEKIRIHDFHRFGCVPPDPKRIELFYGGPMKLKASKGKAVFSIPSSGPQITTTGNSSVKEQRSLCSDNGHFFDEVNSKYLPLETILSEFLEGIPLAVRKFEVLIAD